MSKSQIFAHRGVSREAAENTRAAFDSALKYPIDGMETDVQLSRDGVAVLWHDRFLGKLGLPAKRIDDFDYGELLGMSFVADHDGARQQVMGLQDFLTAYRGRCRLLLEIKNRDGEDEARQKAKVGLTLDMAGKAQNDGILVSSFHLSSLVYAHQCAPDFPLVYNCEASQTVAEAERILKKHPYLYGLCLHKATLGQTMVDLLRSHQKHIAVYTCNSDAEIRRALDLGVDILISDVPPKALQLRDA